MRNVARLCIILWTPPGGTRNTPAVTSSQLLGQIGKLKSGKKVSAGRTGNKK